MSVDNGLHWSRAMVFGFAGAGVVLGGLAYAIYGVKQGVEMLYDGALDQKEALDRWLNSYPPEFAQTLGCLSLVAAFSLALLVITWPRPKYKGEQHGSGI